MLDVKTIAQLVDDFITTEKLPIVPSLREYVVKKVANQLFIKQEVAEQKIWLDGIELNAEMTVKQFLREQDERVWQAGIVETVIRAQKEIGPMVQWISM